MDIVGDEIRARTRALRQCFIDNFKASGDPNPDIRGYDLYAQIEGTIQQFHLEPESYPLDQVVAQILRRIDG